MLKELDPREVGIPCRRCAVALHCAYDFGWKRLVTFCTRCRRWFWFNPWPGTWKQ